MNQAHRRPGSSLSSNHCCFEGSQHARIHIQLCLHSCPWLPFAWRCFYFEYCLSVLPEFFYSSQPSLILEEYRSGWNFQEYLFTVSMLGQHVLFVVLHADSDLLENVLVVALFFESLSLSTFPCVSELQDNLPATFFTCCKFSCVSCSDKWQCHSLLQFIVEKGYFATCS